MSFRKNLENNSSTQPKLIVVVGGGAVPPAETFRSALKNADYIIGADSGAMHVEREGGRLDLVVGDLDSLTSVEVEQLETKTPIYRFPRAKDEIDLVLAIREAEKLNPLLIQIYGWADERLDYSLGLLLALSQSSSSIELISHKSRIEILNLHRPRLHLSPIQGRISIFPLIYPLNVRSEGLRWPIEWSERDQMVFSQSNEIVSQGLLELKNGAVFVLEERDFT